MAYMITSTIIQTCFIFKTMATQYIPFDRTIIIKQVGMNRAMIGIDLQKVEELVLLINIT